MEFLEALWRRVLERTDYERCVRPRAARFELGPVRELLERLGQPQRGVRAIHLAGSKGKGSVAHFLERGLRAAGLRTGLYTSPHLSDWRERARVDGEPAADEDYRRAFAAVLDAAGPGATFFDLMTAAAFLVFRARGCDWWVIETGLGGRFDSTNVLAPAAAVVTSIELEHVDVLGPDLPAIAREKAGIFKAGARSWSGLVPGHPARPVLAAAAAAAGGVLQELPEEVECRADLPYPQPPMRRNFALARAILLDLAATGGAGPALATAAAELARMPPAALVLPGRWEPRRLPDGRLAILDVAHTVESLRPLLAAFRHEFAGRARGVVFALRDDKDAAGLAAALGPAPPGERWFAAPAGDHPRSAAPAAIAPCFGAVPLAAPGFPEGPEVLLVTGSTYLVGALRPRTVPLER